MATAVNAELQRAFDREREVAQRASPRDPAAARAQTIAMYGRLAELQRDVIAARGIVPACRPRCSYCCRLRVEIRPHEAFVLAQHVRARLADAVRRRVLDRLAHNLARVRFLSAAQHNAARVECALLDDGLCTAYEARPAACRKYYSLRQATCRDVHDDPAAPRSGPLEDEHVRLAGNAVALGHAQGWADAGYDAEPYELHFALHHALRGSQAERRYRDGKRAFP